MFNLDDNKMWWVVGIIGIVIVAFFFNGKIMDKVADRVIQKLQKEYTPGPYGPSFDPDKIDPNTFRSPRRQLPKESRPEREDEEVFSR